MSPAEQHWLTLILVTWTVMSLAVLGAMLGSILRYRGQSGSSPVFHAGAVVEAAWMLVPITIVVLMVVLALRVHDAGGSESDLAVTSQRVTDTATATASRDGQGRFAERSGSR
jgi:heme/copper-type cytochrome/quinol oxidase subunit 2